MFHSSYTPEYFSLKQLKQLRDYNATIQGLCKNEIISNNQNDSKYNYLPGLCSML
jgi:hypothetical protein